MFSLDCQAVMTGTVNPALNGAVDGEVHAGKDLGPVDLSLRLEDGKQLGRPSPGADAPGAAHGFAAEVRPFLTYTLALAVIVALAMIYEYRTKQNLFWNWSDKLLPSGFTLNTSSGVLFGTTYRGGQYGGGAAYMITE